MGFIKTIKEKINTTSKWIQRIKKVRRVLHKDISSMDKERMPDPRIASQELRQVGNTLKRAVGKELKKLLNVIKILKNAIKTIRRDRMPEMQNVFRSIGEWWWDLRNTVNCIKLDRRNGFLSDLGDNARNAINDMSVLTVDKAAQIIAGLGVPGLVLIVLMTFSPWYGAAAMTSSLAVLGGPLGMAGGIAMLLILALTARSLANFGFERLFQTVLMKLKMKGFSYQKIYEEINKYPISNELKTRLIHFIKESSKGNGEAFTKNSTENDDE